MGRPPQAPRRHVRFARAGFPRDDHGVITISILVTLSIPHATSLKDKRAVVRSLVERLRTRLHLSAAEVGLLDRVQAAHIGVAVVSGDRTSARAVADEARRFIDTEVLGRADVIDVAVEETALDG